MTWKLDSANSNVEFEIKYMMFTTVRGRFNKFAGALNVNEKNLEKSLLEGSAEVASIDTGDQKRDAHLRSADFFDAEKYPTIAFRNAEVQRLGHNHYKVVGDLTMHNVTHRVPFDVKLEGRAKDPEGNLRMGFSAHTKLNRKDYGLNWNVALEAGGWLVGDEVRVNIEAQLVQALTKTAVQSEVDTELKV